jgi:chitin disaccharide deacetylase
MATEGTFLIVNGDDFGASTGVNRAIEEAHDRGILTSASLLVRRSRAAEAAAYAREHPDMSLGLHLDLGEWIYRESEWVALYEVPIADEDAAEREISAQLDDFRRLVGRMPSHLDSHQHVHQSEPVRSVLQAAASSLDVPLRHYSNVRYCGEFYGQAKDRSLLPAFVSSSALIEIVRRLEPGYTELCCHPDAGRPVAKEVDSLCHPAVRAAVRTAGIQLCSFRDVARS